jgi:hypothetical protein
VQILVTCSNGIIAEASSEDATADLSGAVAREMRRECPVGYDVVDKDVSDGGRHLSMVFVCRKEVAQAEPLKTCGKQESNQRSSN